jgi:hypothetical protein
MTPIDKLQTVFNEVAGSRLGMQFHPINDNDIMITVSKEKDDFNMDYHITGINSDAHFSNFMETIKSWKIEQNRTADLQADRLKD